ncbi:hypothetical protein VCHA53O466_50292 [Vibrio chagasii]|nr:hypothetical protein VCHA53O466_50292 [Vibrio chagasii]
MIEKIIFTATMYGADKVWKLIIGILALASVAVFLIGTELISTGLGALLSLPFTVAIGIRLALVFVPEIRLAAVGKMEEYYGASS